jgi:flagellar biosynthetic protein FliR
VLSILEHFLYHAMPIGLRVAGLMSFAPFLGDIAVPSRIKAVFTIVLTALLYPVSVVPQFALTPWGWARLAMGEITIGLGLGLCMQFVFEGVQLAGQLAGFQLPFSLVNVIDPQTNVDTPVLSVFHQLLALLLFLRLDVHHWILRGLAKSFAYMPIGKVVISEAAMKVLFRDATAMWLVGVQIAAPILLATMLIDVTVGFLSKASPQLPAILLSIPLKSLVGYVVLALAVGLWPSILEKQFALALGWSENMLHLAQ